MVMKIKVVAVQKRSLPTGRWVMCRVIAGSAACPTMAGISAADSAASTVVWTDGARPGTGGCFCQPQKSWA